MAITTPKTYFRAVSTNVTSHSSHFMNVSFDTTATPLNNYIRLFNTVPSTIIVNPTVSTGTADSALKVQVSVLTRSGNLIADNIFGGDITFTPATLTPKSLYLGTTRSSAYQSVYELARLALSLTSAESIDAFTKEGWDVCLKIKAAPTAVAAAPHISSFAFPIFGRQS